MFCTQTAYYCHKLIVVTFYKYYDGLVGTYSECNINIYIISFIDAVMEFTKKNSICRIKIKTMKDV